MLSLMIMAPVGVCVSGFSIKKFMIFKLIRAMYSMQMPNSYSKSYSRAEWINCFR